MSDKLAPEARESAIETLSKTGWTDAPDRDAIQKTYEFENFVAAFAWMTAAAIEAEKLDHHPEWRNVYKTVEVTLTTHDAGGLSALDLNLARTFDRLAGHPT